MFKDVSVNFKSTSFTKTSRMIALKKIGHHVKNFTFRLPHSSETFLPPLLNLETGEQCNFTYVPQVDRPVTPPGMAQMPKYGTEEVTNMLIEQYPPLFHAATNVHAFIKALGCTRNLEQLIVSCPNQERPQLHRRSVVDYALISLRIAIERAALDNLNALTLESIHPAALFYLQPLMGIGSSPGSQRRWSQIEKLSVHMTSFPFNDPDKTEHLRILHSYLRAFSHNLTTLNFSWVGEQKGPSPLSLDMEPVLRPVDRPSTPPKALRFPRLQFMVLQNAIVDSSQVASFIRSHRKSLVEFTFEEITLRSGDWDHALKPLRKMRDGARLSKRHARTPLATQDAFESMDVPCMWSPIEVAPEPRIMQTLEPQQAPSHRGFGMGKWLSGGNRANKKLVKKDWTGAAHFKSVLKNSVFSWR